jgi:HTH-type transcriptional regulator/antitoxin MqsA
MSKSKLDKQSCPECGGIMTFRVKAEDIEYKGRHTTIHTEAWWCTSCDEGILEAAALQANEQAYLQLKAQVEGLLTAEAVAQVRKKLRLSQRKAGELLGGGPRAFQKYESGSVVVSAPMSNLLTLLNNEPSRLKELEGAQEGVAPAASTVPARSILSAFPKRASKSRGSRAGKKATGTREGDRLSQYP